VSTVPQRGRIIYDWFKENPGRHTKDEWLAGTGLDASGKTDAGLKYARGIAIANGQFIPMADAANGFTYILSDQPSEALDAELATNLQTHGMAKWHDKHVDFIASHNFAGLKASEKKYVKARQKKMQARRIEDEADAEMTSAVVAMRHEMRHSSNDQGEPGE
jgi:hypothetical protein